MINRILRDGWNHASQVEQGLLRRGALCALWTLATQERRDRWAAQRDIFRHDNPAAAKIADHNLETDNRIAFVAREVNLQARMWVFRTNLLLTKLFL